MNWGDIGAIAEIVGAVAVVVTLIFLTLQIRRNTTSVRQQCYNDIMVRRQEWYRLLSADPDMTRIFWQGVSGERMSRIDATRFMAFYTIVMGHLEDVFVQYQNGVVEKRIWDREARLLGGAISRPAFLLWWNEARQFFLPEFVEEVARSKPLPLVDYDEAAGTWGRPGGSPTKP